MGKSTDMNRQLLKAYRASGWTRHKLSKVSGVPYATIFGWVSGERRLMFDSANRIADALGLELRAKKGK